MLENKKKLFGLFVQNIIYCIFLFLYVQAFLQAHDLIAAGDFTSVEDDITNSAQLLINLNKKPEKVDSGDIGAEENYNTEKSENVNSDDAGDKKTTTVNTASNTAVGHELSSDSEEEIEESDDTDGTKPIHTDISTSIGDSTRNDNTDVVCWDLPSASDKESAFQPSDNTINDKKHIREDVQGKPLTHNDLTEEHVEEEEINVEPKELKMDGMIVTDNAARTVRMFRSAKESLVSKVSVRYEQKV